MLRTRLIPTLLLKNRGLVKGEKFKNHKYVGDPVNAVKIFNEKEVDEIIFLDIDSKNDINYDLMKDIASEAFMPFGYGGGINNISQIEKLFNLGVEKVIINTAAFHSKEFIKEATQIAGSQSIIVSIDVKKNFFGKYEVYVENGKKSTNENPVDYAKKKQDSGAGELMVCSIDREGTGIGIDIELMKQISEAVEIPVIATGGANSLEDLANVINRTEISAVAAGRMFIYHGKHKAVLITYPKYEEFKNLLD